MPVTLTLIDLVETADIVRSNVSQYFHNYLYYFDVMHVTGCRPAEPLLKDLWSVHSSGLIQLQPLKKNNLRFFNPVDLPDLFLDQIYSNTFIYNHSRLRSLTRTFNSMNTQGKIYTITDYSALYFYRYLRARLLYDSGSSMADIQSFFGWNNSNLASQYVSKSLFRY